MARKAGSTLSRAVQTGICRDHGRGMSIHAIAQKRDLGWGTVKRALQSCGEKVSVRKTGKQSAKGKGTKASKRAARQADAAGAEQPGEQDWKHVEVDVPATVELELAVLRAELSAVRDLLLLATKRLASLGLD